MVYINNYLFPALVDSGATSSTIRFDIVAKLNLDITKCPDVYCSLANGAKINILGTVALKNDTFFDDKKFIINASIFGTSTYPVILGNDFAQAIRLCYNYQNRKIYSIFSGNLFESNAKIVEITHNMIRFSAQTAPQIARTAQPLVPIIPQEIGTDASSDSQIASQMDSNNPNIVSTDYSETIKASNIKTKKIFNSIKTKASQEIENILNPISQKSISRRLRKKKNRLLNKSNNNYSSIVPNVNRNETQVFNSSDSNNYLFPDNNNIVSQQTSPKEVINSDLPIDSVAVQHNSSQQRVIENKQKILAQNYNPKKKSRLILDYGAVIPPNHTVLVSAFIKNFNPGQLYVTNQNPDLVLTHNIAIMHAVVNQQCTGIALTNIGSKTEYLIQGLTICVITPIVDGTVSMNDSMNECVNDVNSARTTNTNSNANTNSNTNLTSDSSHKSANINSTLSNHTHVSCNQNINNTLYNQMSSHTKDKILSLLLEPLIAQKTTIPRVLDENEFKINPKLKREDKSKLLTLLRKYDHIFAKDPYDIGCTNLGEHTIELIADKIVARAPYKTSPKERENIWSHISELLRHKIIKRSLSSYASPVLLVNKHDSNGNITGTRLCVDFRELNKISKPVSYALPLVSDALTCLAGNKYFSTLDSIQGYHQMKVAKDSRHLTAMTTPFGNFEYIRAPFGLSGMVQSFMKIMNKMVGSLQYHELLVYLDDIIIWSKDIESHIKKLETVFSLFEKSNLKLKPSKCFFLFNEINFLGHIVSDKGISTQPAKVKTISELPVPKTVKQLQRFLGMTVYYSKFIESYSTLAYPLYQLIKTEEKTIKNWTDICQKSFEEIKLRLNESPVLIHYNNQKTVYLRCDCSNTASGLILLQEGEDGELHPLTFYSKVLKPHQHKYSTTYKEYLSVLYATRLYRNYLLDKKFVVLTDHKPLLRAKNFKPDNRQLSQLDLLLSEFDFEVNYVTAKNVADADCLSRLPQFGTRKIKNNKYIEVIELISDQHLESISASDCVINCNFCRFTDNLSVSQSHRALPFNIIEEQMKDNYTKTIIDILTAKNRSNPKQYEKVSHFLYYIK